MMKRLLAVLLVLVTGVMLGVGACAALDVGETRSWFDLDRFTDSSDDDSEPDDDPTDGPTDEPTGAAGARIAPDPALQEFYDQEIDWSSCGDEDCATLEVPLVYEEPDGDTIEINLVRRPAEEPDERVGNLLYNPGGPGAPGASYVKEYGDDLFSEALLDRFDIIGFDPRGTGESSPVDCLGDRQLDALLASDPDPDTPAEVRAFVADSKRFGQGCVSRSGDLAGHISTHEAARDMDVLRAALGDAKMSYHGASYGTRLGATYAELFPERVGRFVLDGAVDVSLSVRDSALQQAAGFETALNAYLDDCLEGTCYLGGSRAAAKETITGFLADVEAEPLTVDDRQLQVGNAFYGLIFPLYSREIWGYLDMALKGALDGDAELLLFLADAYASRNASGGYDDNSAEAIWAINCLDDPTAIRAGQVPAEFAAFEKASPTFGRVFAWSLTSCSGLAVEAPGYSWDLDAEGADPILVIGTTRDPATPYRWAKAMASQLDSAILVSRDGDGHTGYNQGSSCVDEVVDDYFIDGTVPDGPVDCD